MASVAEPEVALRVRGLAAVLPTDQMVDLQRTARIGLRPPAHGTTTMQFRPLMQLNPLSLVHGE